MYDIPSQFPDQDSTNIDEYLENQELQRQHIIQNTAMFDRHTQMSIAVAIPRRNDLSVHPTMIYPEGIASLPVETGRPSSPTPTFASLPHSAQTGDQFVGCASLRTAQSLPPGSVRSGSVPAICFGTIDSTTFATDAFSEHNRRPLRSPRNSPLIGFWICRSAILNPSSFRRLTFPSPHQTLG